jgi:hypothetical protein
MLPFIKHPEFYNQPICLSDDQKKNPTGVLVRFFQDHQLCDLRDFFSQVSETCLTSDESPFDEARKRAEFLYYQRQMEILFEAAYLVAQQNQDKDPDNN